MFVPPFHIPISHPFPLSLHRVCFSIVATYTVLLPWYACFSLAEIQKCLFSPDTVFVAIASWSQVMGGRNSGDGSVVVTATSVATC